MTQLGGSPAFIGVFYGENHDDRQIHAFLRERFPGVPVLGGTTSLGTMSEKGLSGDGSIGLFIVDDPDGEYGVGIVELADDAAGAAERALYLALEQAGCAGELPELIWIYQAPGQEEEVIAGLHRVVGDRCPIIGGSSGDNEMAGRWRQLGPAGPMSRGVVVGALFPSGGVSIAFQCGYEPAGPSGVVTQVAANAACMGSTDARPAPGASHGRVILTIDGEPAAQVYNRWLGGALDHKLTPGANVLVETLTCPLGVDTGKIGGIPQYRLVLSKHVLENGALSTFANVDVGTRVFCMHGDPGRLVERAGKVAAAAAAGLPNGVKSLAGGWISYCFGSRLAAGNQIDKVAAAIGESFGGMPFVGCFSLGEQGPMLSGDTHGNLMISALVFGR
ncbi:MAG: FIST C-terminal domain-containing protein [Desulfobulbus sp.]|nr:FIST C-terminal domain-containing protein [Desulfobulbus sp.]